MATLLRNKNIFTLFLIKTHFCDVSPKISSPVIGVDLGWVIIFLAKLSARQFTVTEGECYAECRKAVALPFRKLPIEAVGDVAGVFVKVVTVNHLPKLKGCGLPAHMWSPPLQKGEAFMRIPIPFAQVVLSSALILMATAASAQTSSAGTEQDPIVVAESVRLTANVVAIDQNARTVALRYPDGGEEIIKAGDEVRNFDRIQVGDSVLAEYDRLTSIFTRPPMSGASASEGSTLERATKGEKPRATVMHTAQITATVENVDPGARRVTLRGPQGQTRVVHVPPDIQGIENVKAGNEVVVRQTEAVAIEVVK